jgi:chlorite dismutase
MSQESKLEISVAERTVPRGGEPQEMDERLFMQLQVFTGTAEVDALVKALDDSGLAGVLYRDAADPRGVGLLTWNTDPVHFVTRVRDFLAGSDFAGLIHRPEMTMTGRTYAIGYEPELADWLLDKPRRNATDPEMKWAVWYPLRRNGDFAALPVAEQRTILAEHGRIGMAYGQKGLARDVRLACHGIDTHDNEFVIGLIGSRLHPLSHLVQRLRNTKQTAQYIQNMGPFFIGHAVWQKAGD